MKIIEDLHNNLASIQHWNWKGNCQGLFDKMMCNITTRNYRVSQNMRILTRPMNYVVVIFLDIHYSWEYFINSQNSKLCVFLYFCKYTTASYLFPSPHNWWCSDSYNLLPFFSTSYLQLFQSGPKKSKGRKFKSTNTDPILCKFLHCVKFTFFR